MGDDNHNPIISMFEQQAKPVPFWQLALAFAGSIVVLLVSAWCTAVIILSLDKWIA